jgi:hypothetical protein
MWYAETIVVPNARNETGFEDTPDDFRCRNILFSYINLKNILPTISAQRHWPGNDFPIINNEINDTISHRTSPIL